MTAHSHRAAAAARRAPRSASGPLAVALAIALAGCGLLGGHLTDEQVTDYAKAYKDLRAEGISGNLGQGDVTPKLEAIIERAGFKSSADFMAVQAKVTLAWGELQTKESMAKLDDLEQGKDFEKTLKDPNVPESTKATIRKQLEAARANYDRNKSFAKPVLDVVESHVDGASLEVVRRHEKELTAAMTGRSAD